MIINEIVISSSLLHESTRTKTRFVFQVLNPCSLTFKYLMPASIDGGQDIDIKLEKMLFEFSPGLLTTVTNVVTAFTSLQKVCAFVSVCVFLLISDIRVVRISWVEVFDY